MPDELVKFAQQYYPSFASMSGKIITEWFNIYKETTVIDRDDNGQITGFAIYQKWPHFLNFIVICGKRDMWANLDRLLSVCRQRFAGQKIGWFDETRMKARFIQCHQQQPD